MYPSLLVLEVGVTGHPQLDMLIGDVPWSWIIEFYGDEGILRYLLHHTLAYYSRHWKTLLFHTVDFGGIDPYLLQRLARIMKGSLENIHVSRGFRIGDVVAGLSSQSLRNYDVVILAYPYFHIPGDPRSYGEASRITALIKRLSQTDKRIIIFNTRSKIGTYKPDGGSFHHHTVHVIVELVEKTSGWVTARLFKHPWKPAGARTFFRIREAGAEKPWVVQHRLSEWLSIKN